MYQKKNSVAPTWVRFPKRLKLHRLLPAAWNEHQKGSLDRLSEKARACAHCQTKRQKLRRPVATTQEYQKMKRREGPVVIIFAFSCTFGVGFFFCFFWVLHVVHTMVRHISSSNNSSFFFLCVFVDVMCSVPTICASVPLFAKRPRQDRHVFSGHARPALIMGLLTLPPSLFCRQSVRTQWCLFTDFVLLFAGMFCPGTVYVCIQEKGTLKGPGLLLLFCAVVTRS